MLVQRPDREPTEVGLDLTSSQGFRVPRAGLPLPDELIAVKRASLQEAHRDLGRDPVHVPGLDTPEPAVEVSDQLPAGLPLHAVEPIADDEALGTRIAEVADAFAACFTQDVVKRLLTG